MIAALAKAGGVRRRAATALGMSRPRFNSLLETYEIEHLARERYAMDRITKRDLQNALEQSKGNKTMAARILEIDRVTLYRLLRLSGLI